MAIKTHSLIFVLLLLVIFGIAFGIIIASLTNNIVQQGSGGLTKKQVSDAISLIISDPGFRSEADSDPYWVGNVTRSSFNKFGYMNISGTFVDVPVQIREGPPGQVNKLYTVDLEKRCIMAERSVFSDSLMGSGIHADIPPGAYFYVSFAGNADRYFSNYDRGNFTIGFPKVSVSTADGDILYPMFLDSPNFVQLRDGKQFNLIGFTDKPSNASYSGYGNVPMTGNWSAYVPGQNSTVYFVIKNNDQKRYANILVYELGF